MPSEQRARVEIQVANHLELSEALAKSRDYEAASEQLCLAGSLLFEELEEPAKAKSCLLRARSLDPKNEKALELIRTYFPSLLLPQRPPLVVDAFSHFGGSDGDSNSGSHLAPPPNCPGGLDYAEFDPFDDEGGLL